MDILCSPDGGPVSPEDLDKVQEVKDFLERAGSPSEPPWPMFNGDIFLVCPNLHEREKFFIRVHPDGSKEFYYA